MNGAGDDDDEISTRFRGMTLDRLDRLEAAWLHLSGGAGDPSSAKEALRMVHTMKGDAAIAGFVEVGAISHKLEELLLFADGCGYAVSRDFDLMVTVTIRLMAMIARMRVGQPMAGINLPGLLRQIDDVLAAARAEAPAARPEANAPHPVEEALSLRIEATERLSSARRHRLGRAATDVFLESLDAEGASRERLRAAWHAMRTELAALGDIPLQTRLAKHVAPAIGLAESLGKQVRVELGLDDVMVSAEVADVLDQAVMHCLRNAVDHGLERPEQRRAMGKRELGVISLHADLG
jgi:two-component system chemotaxis sensor kinase CheA